MPRSQPSFSEFDPADFKRMARAPWRWQDAARDLLCTANHLRRRWEAHPRLGFARRGLSEREILLHRHTRPRATLVLCALAVENLLKGLLVARGENPIGPDGRLAKAFSHHNLAHYADRAQLAPTDRDNRLLAQLSQFALSGKYPIGRFPGDAWDAHNYAPAGIFVALDSLLPRIEAQFASFHSRLVRAPADLLRLGASRR